MDDLDIWPQPYVRYISLRALTQEDRQMVNSYSLPMDELDLWPPRYVNPISLKALS